MAADGTARARDLVENLARQHPATGRWLIHDRGCGTGAMGRWLAPRSPSRRSTLTSPADELLRALWQPEQLHTRGRPRLRPAKRLGGAVLAEAIGE